MRFLLKPLALAGRDTAPAALHNVGPAQMVGQRLLTFIGTVTPSVGYCLTTWRLSTALCRPFSTFVISP